MPERANITIQTSVAVAYTTPVSAYRNIVTRIDTVKGAISIMTVATGRDPASNREKTIRVQA